MAYYLPVRGPMGSTVLPARTGPRRDPPGLRPTPRSRRSARTSSTTCWSSAGVGLPVLGPVTDTMVLSYLLESGERNHNLDQLSQRLLGHEMIPITALIGKGKNQITMDLVELSPRSPSTPARMPTPPGGSRRSSPPRSRKSGPLGALRRPGTPVDRRPGRDGGRGHQGRRPPAQPALEGVRREDRRRIEAEIYQEAGRPFNIGSLPQLRRSSSTS